MLERLLDYWYSLEFFQPSWPIKEREDTDLLKNPLPWPEKDPDPKTCASYDIYFGRATAFDLIVWGLERLKLATEDSPIERDQSKVCICALKVDKEGVYVNDSFAISSFVWALGVMVKANDFNVKLDLGDLDRLQNRINMELMERETPFIITEFQAIERQVCSDLGVDNGISGIFAPAFWARKKTLYQKKDGTFPVLEPSTELMSSFYLREIARVKKNPGKRIRQYAEALCSKQPNRVMIDSDTTAMQQWLEADRFPSGAWPSAYSPSLMQQLAINLGISGQDIFSVNGPPGTGKTTLLKEIITSNIVRRAALMAAYTKPDDAFQKYMFESPPDDFNQTFYRPNSELTAYGMLVASNNNAAVENISIELPKAIEKDRTGHFTNIENMADTYFSDVATALLGEPAWGLISARLGKGKNLREFKERLWWTDESTTLKQYYAEAPPDWDIARQKFFEAVEAVKSEQVHIAGIQKTLNLYTKACEAEHTEIVKTEQRRGEANKQNNLYHEYQAALKELEETYSLQQQNVDILKSSLSGFKHLMPGLFKKDPVVHEWKKTRLTADEALISVVRQRTKLQAHTQLTDTAKQQLSKQEEALQRIREQRGGLEANLENERKRFGANFADEAFWQNICANESSQSACPWTNEIYDALREELFYRALMLQKAFVLGSNSVKQNMNRLFGMWDGRFTSKDRETAYGSLINTLFFVVPVISTTFASVQTFLDGVQPDELGLLVVDEAGQATPQSALGALWRTRKAIIVGDPLQVEPIMTTPVELRKRFAKDNNLPSDYRIPELSVQKLADAQNPYGGLREINDEQLWLGCPLVVHRRCIEPMFSMSNRVAYSDRMFCKTPHPSPEKEFLLEKSTWFDVSGEEVGNKNHTVHDQINLVVHLIEEAVSQFGGFPDVYIITPFTSVKRSLEQKLRPMLQNLLPGEDNDSVNNWIDKNCGTIHTFQGKEANEVLLVLGCDNQKGMAAARWVGQKPNIINVAVSRAKYRIGVIGSYSLWSHIPHVRVVCGMLKESIATRKLNQ